ncbi:Pr6Pr family membrane protein [Streptomyces sp. WI04-05B]|uniref:Pr6Pr family membrane protein n=1 Tax=Streptomyces TaxID=1883 RepID=UPI0029B237E0|nr:MULTISPECIES: Pr6Pr family membrane protein [unclassified Streptomyces]MDX2544159.1 Pr6Pr family membrane protein [Streptomyces sp. WI04-05B]MDX2584575.1 Pr6Pr family membrane protein [Streptomyces sp. WI04-05A]
MTAPIPRDIPDLPALPGGPGLLPSPVPATAVVTPVRRPVTAVFRLLTAAAAAAAVTTELVLGSPAQVLSQFTIQSSILLTLVMTVSARRAWTARRPLPSALAGAALLYVVIGALVHHILVANPSSPFTTPPSPTGWHAVTDQVLHTAIPIAALTNWLLLTAAGHLHLRQAAPWLLYPLAYLTFSLLRGELLLPGSPNRYLYAFLDVDEHGYKSVLANALLLGLAFYTLAVLVITLDHIRPNPVHHRAKTGFRLGPPVG